MGSTIGINTLLLLASITLIVDDVAPHFLNWKRYNWSLLVFNLSLVIFWVCLVGMGLVAKRSPMVEAKSLEVKKLRDHMEARILAEIEDVTVTAVRKWRICSSEYSDG
jgi:hypothetical protein